MSVAPPLVEPAPAPRVLGTHTFVVSPRYALRTVVGGGAYGVVADAVDTVTGEPVAIKKMANVFGDPIDTRRIIREIHVLRALKHPNVLSLRAVEPIRDEKNFNEVYLITELMDADLAQIIRRIPFTRKHSQYYTAQLLRAVAYIHSAGLVHRDLKPANLLTTRACILRVCDFGLVREMFAPDPTGYVTTRWYRAPEILMADRNYTHAIDLWSVGCIIVEMFTRQPLLSGRNYVDQLQRQVNLLGRPRAEDLTRITNESARQFVLHCPRDSSTPSVFALLASAIGDPSAPYLTDLMHLLAILLAWDPRNRRSAAELIDPNPHQTYETSRRAAAAAVANKTAATATVVAPATVASDVLVAGGGAGGGTTSSSGPTPNRTAGSSLTDNAVSIGGSVGSNSTAPQQQAAAAGASGSATGVPFTAGPHGSSQEGADAADDTTTFRVAGAVALPSTPPPACLPIPFVMGGITIYERAFKVGADGVPLHGITPAPEAILAHGGQHIATPSGPNDSLRADMARAIMMAYKELCSGTPAAATAGSGCTSAATATTTSAPAATSTAVA